MLKKYFIWHKAHKQFIGEAIKVDREKKLVTLTGYTDETLTETREVELSLDDVELFEVSPIKDIDEQFGVEDSIVQFSGNQDEEFGILKQDDKGNWDVILLQNINGQLTTQHDIRIPFEKTFIEENEMKVVGHLKGFQKHVENQ